MRDFKSQELFDGQIDKLMEAMDAYIRCEKFFIDDEGCSEVTAENITDSFEWLSLKFWDRFPKFYEQTLERQSDIPEVRMAEILGVIAKKSIPNMFCLNGVSIRLIQNDYRFCISGSISEDDFQKLSGLRRE